MNTSKTTLQTFRMGDQLVTTVHRIECDGKESADIISVSDPLELSLVDDSPRGVVKGEHVYDWQR